MKKNVLKSTLCVISSLFMFWLCSCDNEMTEKKDETREPAETYASINTEDFTLPDGWRWMYSAPQGEGTGMIIINSQEELMKHLSDEGDALSSIDFNKNSLLLVFGDTLRNIYSLTYQLVRVIETEEYQLNVDILTGTDAWPRGWVISTLIPKVSQNTEIRLNEVIKTGNPGGYNDPYMEDITGAWKLEFHVAGEDSLDCSKSNVVYNFGEDGKLTITGNSPDGLSEGEYSYEYKKTTICRTCTPVPNLRISNDNGFFCEAYSPKERMIISRIYAGENGTITSNLFFNKIEVNTSDDKEP